MSQEFCQHVFDAFEREWDGAEAQTEGSGLGLAITKRLVEEMDGYAAARAIRALPDEKQASVPIIAVIRPTPLRRTSRPPWTRA